MTFHAPIEHPELVNDVTQPTCIDCGTKITKFSRGRCKRCGYRSLKRAIPEDFMDILKRSGSAGAASHYRTSLSTITAWRKAMGLQPQARMSRPKKYRGAFDGTKGVAMRLTRPNRDMTTAGQAAFFLTRYGAVYRCNERGGPNPKGEFWNRNGHVLTDEQIIHRAKRLGWVEAGVL